MTTVLAGVTLDDDMHLQDEYKYSLVNSSVEKTIGGGIVVQEYQALEKGRKLTLTSLDTTGMLKKSTVDSLIAAAMVAGATFSLVISTTGGGSLTRTVRFRHEVEDGPIQMESAYPRSGLHNTAQWYKGSIYLMVV